MKLKVGDFVEVLDEDLSGEIIFINNNKVIIQTEEDFELEFEASQLIKTQNSKLLRTSVITSYRRSNIKNFKYFLS